MALLLLARLRPGAAQPEGDPARLHPGAAQPEGGPVQIRPDAAPPEGDPARLHQGAAQPEGGPLAERVQQLEAETRRLAAQLTARAAPEPAAGPAGVTVRVRGFVHADAALYRQESEDQLNEATGQPLNETRFVIRRARLRIEADYRYLGGAFELDGNTVQGPLARILGAEVFVQWPPAAATPYVRLTLGLFKIPFGYEVPQADTQRLFLERSSIVRALFPGEYDLGVRVHGGWRFLRYAAAAMNGQPLGERAFAARDPNQSKDFLGRLGVAVAVAAPLHLQAGVSGLYGTGFHPGTPATKDVLTWRDDNGDGQVQLSELQALRGTAATASQNFARSAVGVDAQVALQVPRLGELAIYGEVIWAQNLDRALVPADPVAAGRELRELGYYLGLTQELTPYASFGLRYDHYQPDADASQQLGVGRVPVDSSFSTLAVAAAVQQRGLGRLTLEYDHNRNALGRGAGGAPTTLGREAVMLRGQIVF